MTDNLLLLHTFITIVGIIALIVFLKIHPVFSLIAGVLYLGIVSGLGLQGTLDTLTGGFGDILAEIGLLIAFGVTMGTAMHELGAIDRIVRGLMRMFGRRNSTYALGVTAGTALQAIFADVMLVVTAPVARGLARSGGRHGIPRASAALVTGILVGLTMMIPSVGSLALAGVIEIPLWRYLVFGTIVGTITIVITIFIMNVLIDSPRFWKSERDEDLATFNALDAVGVDGVAPSAKDVAVGGRQIPLLVTIAPLVVALALIAAGSITDVYGVENAFLAFISAPTIALLIGAFSAVSLVRFARGQEAVGRTLSTSFSSLGEVLVLTGLGGSLSGLVKASGLGDVLGDFFENSAGPPILLAWFIAVVLHVAIGSVSIAAITAAGILAPVAASAGIDPMLIALAAAAGALCMMTVHSNFFWMAKNLLGLTTTGAVKIVGGATTIASVVGLAVVLLLSLVL